MKSINKLLDDLLKAADSKDVEEIVLSLVEMSKTDMNAVVESAVAKIRKNEFDGSKWSTLTFSILANLKWPEKPGEILRALVEHDEDNGAYLNNFGIFTQMRGQIGQAIEYYARAYATDYKHHGHEKASSFPAWKNLREITSKIKNRSTIKER